MGFVEGAREVAQARGLTVIPDVLASSSSAAMVCRQLKAKGTLGEEALWGAIEGAITQRVTEAMAAARLQQTTVRQAHLDWATP